VRRVLGEAIARALLEGYDPPRVAAAESWYLTEGYKRARAISVYEVPAS
jgi:hypothetical protein